MMETPVLLINFNRPDHTKQVLEAIRSVEPKELFVFQDGARRDRPGEQERCASVREIISAGISWPCQLHSYFSETNLGCGPGPASAISWFFANVDQGIILEDDAVPHHDFFLYAEELLERYKDNPDIHAIGSMNVDTQKWGDGSYYFSRMNRNLCAWATWRRAWETFDISMESVSRRSLDQALKFYHCEVLEREYWCDRLDEVHKNGCEGKSWDMQFLMSIWLNHGKGIIPNVNLSSNIGTVGEATHEMAAGNIIDNVPTSSILPLKHPGSTDIQYKADREFHFRYFEPWKKDWTPMKTCYYILNKWLKKAVGHQGPWINRK